MNRNRNYETVSSDLEPCCDREESRPMPMEEMPVEQNRAKEINIQPLNFGYIIRVGCQSFAIESADKLISSLNEYLKDPQKIEKSWFNGTFLK